MTTEVVIRADNGNLKATAYSNGKVIGETPTLDARGLLRALPGLFLLLALAHEENRTAKRRRFVPPNWPNRKRG